MKAKATERTHPRAFDAFFNAASPSRKTVLKNKKRGFANLSLQNRTFYAVFYEF